MATQAAPAELSKTNQPRSVRRDLLELAIGYFLIMATIWTPNPTQRVLYWLAFAWIVATSWARHDSWTTLGLGRKGLLQSLWVVGVALLLSAASIFIAWRTHTLHHLHGGAPLLQHGWAYVIWALMQQFILQSYFLQRLLRLLPGKVAPVIAAAGIFALAHLPNPILTPITLLWGAIACILFLRYRNIYTLGLAHGIMGLCVAVTVPSSLHHNMRVGLGYLRYHRRPQDRRLVERQTPPDQALVPQSGSLIADRGTQSAATTGPGAPHLDLRCGHRANRVPRRALLLDRLEKHNPSPYPAKTAIPQSSHRSHRDQSVSTDACVTADAPTLRS